MSKSEFYRKVRDAIILVTLAVMMVAAPLPSTMARQIAIEVVIMAIGAALALHFWLLQRREKRAEKCPPPARGATVTGGNVDTVREVISAGSCLPYTGGGIGLPRPPGGDGE